MKNRDGETIRIDHTGDGTVVDGIRRGDEEVTQALSASGFRWSNGLGAWYLPQTWTFNTRDLRVRAFMASLPGRNIEVTRSQARTTTAAERQETRQDASAARADRLGAQADRLRAESERRQAAASHIGERFAGGQPIIAGHSEKGALNDRTRMDNHMEAASRLTAHADNLRYAARSAASNAVAIQSPVTLANKVEALNRALRDIDRKLEGYKNNRGDVFSPAQGEYRESLLIRRSEVVDERTVAQTSLDEVRVNHDVPVLGPTNVVPGDVVIVRGRAREVVRANRTTVAVKAGNDQTDNYPYHRISRLIPKVEVEEIMARLSHRDDVAVSKAATPELLRPASEPTGLICERDGVLFDL